MITEAQRSALKKQIIARSLQSMGDGAPSSSAIDVPRY